MYHRAAPTGNCNMEKLQAALAKARNQREQRDSNPVVASKVSDRKRDRWPALKQVSLSNEMLRKHRIVGHSVEQQSTSFDVLRTKIVMQMRRLGWTRLAITSPSPNSGKTTIACNLALGLGRQASLRTMLLDFDLGSPSVHRYLGIDRTRSLSAVLSGEVAFHEHAVCVGENVAVVTSCRPDPDPTRLVMSQQTEVFLDQIQEDYQPDVMIFDLPAILSGDRARAFLKSVDCALIVARAEQTRFNQLDICESEVAESTNVIGVVMNGCHPNAMPRTED